MNRFPFVPYQTIEKHGMIGDRRTAALVAADGTIDWWCLPNFDNPPVFGALLDPTKGGFCRLGPHALEFGHQAYADDSGILITRWVSARLLSGGISPDDRHPCRRKANQLNA